MKKIIGYLVIVLLFAGSICGIVFGVKYAQNEKYIQDNSSAIEQVEKLKDTIELLTDNNEKLQLNFDNLQNSYNENLDLIESYKTQVSTLTEQLTSKENELTEKNEYIDDLESAKAELESQAVLDEAEIERLDTLLTQANQDKATLQSEIDQKTTTISELNISISELEEENSSLNSTIISLQEQIASLNSQIETTTSQLDEALTQGELDAETISSLTSQVESLTTQNENLSSQVIALNNQVLELQAELAVYEEMNLSNYAKLTFINDSNDAIVSTSYVLKNSTYNNPPIIENTYDYWFYGWATTEESEEVVNFENFTVDNDYTFYSVLSDNIDLYIFGDENYFEYAEDERGENTGAGTRQAVYRYGENLTVGDILQIKDKVIIEGIENGDISYQFLNPVGQDLEYVTLDTKLKDLPDSSTRTMMDGVYYDWCYKFFRCNLTFTYNEKNIYAVQVGNDSQDYSSFISLKDFNDRDVNVSSLNNINFTITYQEETVDVNISKLLSKQNEFVADYKSSCAFYGVKITPFENKEIEVHFLINIEDFDSNAGIFKVVDPSLSDDAGYTRAEIDDFCFNVEYDDKYISYLPGIEYHEFWYNSNLVPVVE